MKRVLGTAFLLMTFTAVLSAQSDLQPLVTVKLHKTESITLKQLKNRVAMYQKQTGVPSFSIDEKKEILNAMIDEKLATQAAHKAGL